MNDIVKELKERPRGYRVILILALAVAGLRLVLHGIYAGVMLYPDQSPIEAVPLWVESQDASRLPVDVQIYVDAARRFQNRQDLYPNADAIEVYQYPPAYAAAFIPFLSLSPLGVVIVHTLLHIVAYWGLFLIWHRIFDTLGLARARDTLIVVLPLWLVFTGFWSDLAYLNIYLIVALISTLLIEAVIHERLGLAVLWLSVLLHIKPHWAFAAAVPLLLGRYRFFFKMVGFSIAAYFVVVGGLMGVAGPDYVGQQYVNYVRFIGVLSRDFPWRGPNARFLGYNHSIKQITVYLGGVETAMLRLATLIKILLLAPLGWICLRSLIHPIKKAGQEVPSLSLDLAFVLYMSAFIWLDMVWELSLGIVIFPYLLAKMERRIVRALLWAVFLPYALVDLWRAVSFMIWGADVIAPGAYILTDPSLYVPVVMGVIVTFYVSLLVRLWRSERASQMHDRHAPMMEAKA